MSPACCREFLKQRFAAPLHPVVPYSHALLPQQVRTAMRNDTESPFSLTLTQSNLRLQVLRFKGREALNQPYRFDLELSGLAPPTQPHTQLRRPAFPSLECQSGV